MKIAFATFAIVASLITSSQASSNRWGQRARTDILLYKGRMKADAFEARRSKVDFVFPAGKSLNTFPITEIRVIDKKTVNGGFAKIMKGGLGSKTVKLSFESDPGESIDYTLEIYGCKRVDQVKYPLNSGQSQYLSSDQYLLNTARPQNK